jgi:TonB family protein
MFSRAVTAAMLAAICAAPAFGGVLQPVGKWIIDYREDQCLASRDYGRPDKPLRLGVRPAPTGQTYELLVAQPRSGPEFAKELAGAVDFGHGDIKAWLLSYAAKGSKSNVYQFRISAADMAQAASAATVTVKPDGAPNLTFALDSMPALLEGLHACTGDLQRYWNATEELYASIAVPAIGDVRSVFSEKDYPREAIRLNQRGSSQFLLLIDEKGGVAGCHVLKASGIPLLDAMGCQVIRQRAKFIPAIGRDGKAVRSSVTTPLVVWRIAG